MTRTYEKDDRPVISTQSTSPNFQARPFAPPQSEVSQVNQTAEGQSIQSKSLLPENSLRNGIFAPRPESSGRSVQRDVIFSRRTPVQAKLNIGEPDDKYEKEADSIAAKVVHQINSSPQNNSVQTQKGKEDSLRLQRSPKISKLQRQASVEEDDEELQRSPLMQRREKIGGGEASDDLESSIQSARGGGQSLDSNLQVKMGHAMGADFSRVKVHTDSRSDQLNKSIQAKAFTTGQDVFFRQGAYQPSSRGGQELIAHELTHVVQQNSGTVQRSPLEKQDPITPKSHNIVQRTMVHVNQIIDKYADLTGDRSTVGPYRTWPAVARQKRSFSAGQWRKIEIAHNYKEDGTPTIVDRSGHDVGQVERSDGDYDFFNTDDEDIFSSAQDKMFTLSQSFPTHYALLDKITERIKNNLGDKSLLEFWKGAHIVFKDGGSEYGELAQIGDAIASKKSTGQIKSKTELVGLTSFNYFGWGSSTGDQRAGSMMTRSPGTGETGHYKDQMSSDTNSRGGEGGPPQYGVDMPEVIGGHLLFGLTYDGDTFVQTEGAGFQNFWEGSVAHGLGALTVRGYAPGSSRGMQTGMLGNSMHSEDPNVQTEIREHENLPWKEFLASIG